MKEQDINKPQLEERINNVLTDLDLIPTDAPRFTYFAHGRYTIYLWMDFDTTEEYVTLAELNKVKRAFKNEGFKVSQIKIFPLASCQLSFRIIFEL